MEIGSSQVPLKDVKGKKSNREYGGFDLEGFESKNGSRFMNRR
jgi:hypothetical protein